MKSRSSSITIRVAAIQYNAIPFDKAGNLKTLEELIMQAAQAGAQLVVLPEMCTTGLIIGDRKNASILAETVPGPSTDRFAELADRLKIMIVFGLITRDVDVPRFHNSQVLLSADGQILACYNKRHLYGPDWQWADPGTSGFKAIPTNLGVIGLGICFDFNFADLWTFFHNQDVDIFSFSTNWVEDCSPLPFWDEVARHTGIHIIAANNWGREQSICFSGESAVIFASYGILATSGATGNTVVIADIVKSVKTSCRQNN